ncbi:DUF1648 domain-containing protein [Candidatus Uabimicrobium sp. HlEnr_7]|uniref:DUF1648 domain-containing protein n=1 Tax=Candidatus Uabimicrobium helgolandensis TaxID=3095367 RepID=UPI003556DCB7
MIHLFRLLWLGLFIALGAQIMSVYPQLPEQIAVHFNVQGQADAFGGKQEFYIFFSILIAFLNIIFLCISVIIKKIPNSILSVPWKSYWFANEERSNIAYRKLSEILAMAAVLFNGLFYLINLIILRSSTSPEPCPTGDFIHGNFIWIALSCTTIHLVLSFLIIKPPKS